MEFFRAYAFAVIPQRTTSEDNRVLPQGGPIKVNAEIRDALATAMLRCNLSQQCLVNFDINPETRTNDVRDLILQIAFGNSQSPAVAAACFAVKLSEAMDQRSPNTLLVIAVARPDKNSLVRQITLWAFPREEAFQFETSGKDGPQIKYLKDVFSQSSTLRKAALFEGRELRTDFLSGRVLDFQTTGSHGRGADYWIDTFLNCQLGITSELGTKAFASALRKAFAEAEETDVKEQISQGTIAIRASRKQTWSVQTFADEYLDGKAKELVLKASKNNDARRSSFNLDKDLFDKEIGMHVFKLENEITVSAPFNVLGKQVNITDGKIRQLTCKGTIIEERLKAKTS